MSISTPPNRDPKSELLGGCLVFLLIGFVWLLIVTWPWCLLLLPVLVLISLAKSPKLRSNLRASFTRETIEPEIVTFRNSLMALLFVFGAISAVICAFTVGLDNIGWWLIPLALLALAIRLRALSIELGRWPRLQRALCDNLLELMVIAGIALSVYWLALLWFKTAPLDTVTLQTLIEWDKKVHETHEWFENHTSGLGGTLLLLGVVLSLRIAAALRPDMASFTGTASGILSAGAKWVGRASTLVAVAASFTFLATSETGPAGQISLKLKDAKQDYDHFQSALTNATDQLLSRALVDKAWKEIPPPLSSQMANAARFQQERDRFEKTRTSAEQAFEFKFEDTAAFPLAAAIPAKEQINIPPPNTDPASSWTPAALHQAAADADILEMNVANEPSEKNEAAEDIAKNAFEKLLPADRLFESAPAISLLESHYPVFGEFLDAIVSSVSDSSFDAIRARIVKRVTQRRADHPNLSLDTLVSDQVAVGISATHFDLRRFDQSWADETGTKLARYREEVGLASNRVESVASEKLHKQTEAVYRSTQEPARTLGEVGAAVHSAPLRENAAAVQRIAAELEILGMSWPALAEPNAQLRERLSAIGREIQQNGFTEVSFATPFSRGASQLGNYSVETPGSLSGSRRQFDYTVQVSEWSTPLQLLASLGVFCNERIVEAVATSSRSPLETLQLRGKLGDQYDSYYREWQARLQRQADERRLEQQRKEEAQHKLEQRELEQRRIEEMTRRAERPMEMK
jgi:hypothetical protein